MRHALTGLLLTLAWACSGGGQCEPTLSRDAALVAGLIADGPLADVRTEYGIAVITEWFPARDLAEEVLLRWDDLGEVIGVSREEWVSLLPRFDVEGSWDAEGLEDLSGVSCWDDNESAIRALVLHGPSKQRETIEIEVSHPVVLPKGRIVIFVAHSPLANWVEWGGGGASLLVVLEPDGEDWRVVAMETLFVS